MTLRCKNLNISRLLVIVMMVFIIGQLSYGQDKTLEFIDTIKNDTVYLDLKNYLSGPVFIEFGYNKIMKEHIRGPEELVIQPQSCTTELIALPIEYVKDTSSIVWKDFFEVSASLGDPNNSSHNDSILYDLPFTPGKKYRIMQSWNGRLSHFSKESKYALDFDMPEGDTIRAARAGIVIRTVDHYTENGGKELRDQANQIVILHDDGTMAFYVHLLYKGVLVEAGDTVRREQVIGLSGNTGYSTKPHLHFVVREAPDKSVPIYFEGYKRKAFKEGNKVGH